MGVEQDQFDSGPDRDEHSVEQAAPDAGTPHVRLLPKNEPSEIENALMPWSEEDQLADLEALLAELSNRPLLNTGPFLYAASEPPPLTVLPPAAEPAEVEPAEVEPLEVELPADEPEQLLPADPPPAAEGDDSPEAVLPEAAVDAAPEVAAELDTVKPSLFRRELKLGRRRRPAAEVLEPAASAEHSVSGPQWLAEALAQAATGDTVAEAPVAKQSLLKREIKLGRRRRPDAAPPNGAPDADSTAGIEPALPALTDFMPATEVEEAPAEKPSLLKREIKLGRRRRPKETEVAPEAEATVVLPPEMEPELPELPLFPPVVEPEPAELEPATPIALPEPDLVVPEPEAPAPADSKPAAVEPKPSRRRRELSLPSLKRPASRSTETPAPTEGEAQAAAAKQSALRKEIRLGKPNLSLPSLSRLRGRAGSQAAAQSIVGLRIGSSQLAAALVANNGTAELVQLARTPLARGVVGSGEVRDVDALARALKSFFAEHKLPHKNVRLGIANNRIGVRVLDVPASIDPKLLANAIRFRAQEAMPFPMSEAVLDHVLLGEPTGEGEEAVQKVLVVFAHRHLVDQYVAACRSAGLKLAGIDFDAFALLRAVNGTRTEEPRNIAVVAVAIGRDRTIFAVSDGQICDFARVLEWGGGSLDLALAEALDVAPVEAEQFKQALTLTGVEHSELTQEQVEKAHVTVRAELHVLARELVSSLQFYQSRPGSLDIGEILLTGGGAELVGIDAELTRMVGVPVRIAEPLAQVRVGDGVRRPAEAGSLTIAVGLGMDEQA